MIHKVILTDFSKEYWTLRKLNKDSVKMSYENLFQKYKDIPLYGYLNYTKDSLNEPSFIITNLEFSDNKILGTVTPLENSIGRLFKLILEETPSSFRMIDKYRFFRKKLYITEIITWTVL